MIAASHRKRTTAALVATTFLCFCFTVSVASAASRPRVANETAEAAPAMVININTATEEELMQLPGVGPAKAAAIVEWRKKHGQFKKVDDLVRVRGFGRKTLLRLKAKLTVQGPSLTKNKAAAAAPTTAAVRSLSDSTLE
ncbi:MAG: helix-hairpin-helix domain-containing protein [Pseudomonadota bacterium]